MLGLIGWIGRIILILLIIRMVVSFISGAKKRPGTPKAGGQAAPRGARSEKAVAQLVRDPQCGTYVAETSAVTASQGGATLYFCSDRCRDEYVASPRATAV